MNATRTLIQAFLGGSILIVGLRTLVPDDLFGAAGLFGETGLLGATLAALAAIVIIAVVGWRYDRAFDNAEDRQVAGDNLYYLGLLFTLISLILALFQLFVLEAQEDVNRRAYELIGNFGVALFSTVAGIFARILFQGHERGSSKRSLTRVNELAVEVTPIETNDSALAIDTDVRELREELTRLRLVLREASDAFLHFSRISSEQSETVVVHTGSMMQRQSEDLGKTTVHQLEQMQSSLKSVADTFQAEMNALSNHCTKVISEFMNHLSNEARQGIADTSQAWNDAAIKMKADGERQIKAIHGDINALLQNTEQAWAQMADLSGGIGEAVAGMRENVESLRVMVTNSASAGAEMKLLLEAMNNARSELESVADAAGRSTAEIESGIREFADEKSKLGTELIETRLQAVKEYREATAQITDHVSEQLESGGDRLQSAILKMANDMENHQKVGAEQLGKASQLGRQMSDEAEEWSKLAENTRKSLVEAAEHLVSVVKKN